MKICQEGDLVMVYLCNRRLLRGTSGKLRNKKNGTYQVLKNINENAYVIDLQENMAISSTFIVTDIFDYYLPIQMEIEPNSKNRSFQARETHVGRHILLRVGLPKGFV